MTPMMAQYLKLKEEHRDEVLFFRLGDFYEMFLDDAVEVSRILNITLTSRNSIPMCGIPYHAAKTYIKRLLDAGKKIAICEQTEIDPQGRTLAKREVVQTITPATAVEDEYIEHSSNNYLLTISLEKEIISCAYSELSSGTIYLVELENESRFVALRSLYEQLSPKEILINEEDYFKNKEFGSLIDQTNAMTTRLPAWYFSVSQGFKLLTEHLEVVSLKQFGLEGKDLTLSSGGALFRYLKETANTNLKHIDNIKKVDLSKTLLIDESSRKNLELLNNLQDSSQNRTLFSSLNRCCTSGGARLLKEWISFPLNQIDEIEKRLDWVTWFIENESERQRIRSILKQLKDLSRLATRVSMNRATASDLVAIRFSIEGYFELAQLNEERYRSLSDEILDDKEMLLLVELMQELLIAIKEETLGPFKANHVIKEGYDSELDELRDLTRGGSKKLNAYVEKLRKETSISLIKLGQNKIIGHYLEIPKTHNDKIPPYFYRKQTLVNQERYTTDELLELEDEILSSFEKAEQLEKSLLNQLLQKTADLTKQLIHLGHFFSQIDTFCSLAEVANSENYCRPQLVENNIFEVNEGRHPVVEQYLSRGEFVPNDLFIDENELRFCLITGPNMAGKSTYLRQNALILLMAHMGSYVPATKAIIGLTDRLFCRVGASDNLARGESTFLIEMQEAAYILRNASRSSLAIIDEIGRGTSTQDGMSIAYAVMRKLAKMGVKTLFATHYHELTMLDTSDMQLLTLSVVEKRNSVLFLRKVEKGVATSSYGLHVAKMAGLPLDVLKEASVFQKNHFADYELGGSKEQLDLFTGSEIYSDGFQNLYLNEIEHLINSFDLENSTPIEALKFVQELQKRLEEERSVDTKG